MDYVRCVLDALYGLWAKMRSVEVFGVPVCVLLLGMLALDLVLDWFREIMGGVR